MALIKKAWSWRSTKTSQRDRIFSIAYIIYRSVEYLFAVYTSGRLYWNKLTDTWIDDGCTVRQFHE